MNAGTSTDSAGRAGLKRRQWRAPAAAALLLAAWLLAFARHGGGAAIERGPSFPPPASLLEAGSLGFLRQLFAEMLFVESAVHYGAEADPWRIPPRHLDAYAALFRVMARLHPRLLDVYYRVEGVLTWQGERYAREANAVLRIGRRALPDEIVIPFFIGFNDFRFLHQPLKAADAFEEAARMPEAPGWFGHLAAILRGRGGDIRGGLLLLQARLRTTSDAGERERLQRDIRVYKDALRVQLALERFHAHTGRYPTALSELAPAWLARIPDMGGKYELVYQPPRLSLRPKEPRHRAPRQRR